MYIDTFLRLATAEAAPAGPNALGAIWLDSTVARDIGAGQDLYCRAAVTTAVTSGTAVSTHGIDIIALPDTALTRAGAVLDIADADTNLADTVVLANNTIVTGTPFYFTSLTTTTGNPAIANSTIYYAIAGVGAAAGARFKFATTLAGAYAGTAVDLLTGDGSATINWLPVVIGSSGPIVKDFLTIGKAIEFKLSQVAGTGGLPGVMPPMYRYLFVRYNGSVAYTAGNFTIDLVLDAADSRKFYAPGFTIIG